MELDHQHCYAIIKSRDARFDGRFYAGVLTTGIYCRPICPARKPRPKNVRFFVTAAAAEEAGLRPCLRCRPESSPGTPDWSGSSALVARALRLISEGFLDGDGIPELAGRLHVGPRHLRRLFLKHLGAPPIAVAQNRRVLFAKKLLTETSLPVTEVAFSAGFSSIRRFNAAMHKTYGQPPSALRTAAATGLEPSHFELKLAYRPPYDWGFMRQYLQARAIPGVEFVDQHRYVRTASIEDRAGLIQVQPVHSKNALLLRVSPTLSRNLLQIADRTRRLFDLSADPLEIGAHLGQDEWLASRIRQHPGIRVPGTWDGFETAIRAILGQQVSLRAANTLAGRLVAVCGRKLETEGQAELTHLFPTAAQLSGTGWEDVGLPASRIRAIRELAGAVRDGRLQLDTAASLEEAVDGLTALPGIGPWTAHYIALRVYGEPDAFPAHDLVLRKAAGQDGKPASAADLQKLAEAWRPWRAYAAMYLWRDSAAR